MLGFRAEFHLQAGLESENCHGRSRHLLRSGQLVCPIEWAAVFIDLQRINEVPVQSIPPGPHIELELGFLETALTEVVLPQSLEASMA